MPDSSDPYTYPGTDVLRNFLDVHDPQQLGAFEANATAARLIELDAAPLAGQCDVAHLKAIHRYIFQDVYSWAGEFRTVNISVISLGPLLSSNRRCMRCCESCPESMI